MTDPDERHNRELDEVPPRARYEGQGWPPPDDEISLFDLFDALVRRRWLIVGVAAGVTVLALIYALMQPDVYTYRSVVELGVRGQTEDGADVVFVESPSAVRQKFTEAYIPASRQAIDKPGAPAPNIDVRTDSEGGTGLFVLATEATTDDADRVTELHQGVVQKLEADHERLLSPVQRRSRNELQRAQSELQFLQRDAIERARLNPLRDAVQDAERELQAIEVAYRSDRLDIQNELAVKRREAGDLEDERERLQSQLKRVDEREALAEEQLASVRDLIARLEDAGMTVTGNIQDSADAMTVLTVGSQISEARVRADDLEDRLRLDLPERREELRGKLQDNRRAQETAADEIENLENRLAEREAQFEREKAAAEQKIEGARTSLEEAEAEYEQEIDEQQRVVAEAEIALDTIEPTESLFVGERSIRQAGTSGTLILALGMVLGGMLGVFAGFLAEFIAAARRRHHQPVEDTEAIEHQA